MAYAKKQTKGGQTSKNLHSPRPTAKKSRRARDTAMQRKLFNGSRRAILTIIVLAGLTVILTLLYISIATPEQLVKGKIESIAKDYYENYFYEDLLTYAPTTKSLDEIMAPYAEYGFSNISLRQLLLFDNQRHADSAALLKEYCDENSTTIRIYPHVPYSKTDYEIKYNYSCTF